jgi:E3 ubiquitin-protein ligase BRE1
LLNQQNLTKITIPKKEENTTAEPTSSSVLNVIPPKSVPSPRPSPSPRPKKRLRESSSNNKLKQLEEEDEDNSNASAFYLKHQNRALASELRSVKYQLSRLERERDFRRSQCSESVQSINALESIWGQLESSLGGGSGNTNAAGPASGPSDDAAPLSTGSGSSVEMIGAFMNSLARLGGSLKSRRTGEIDDQGGQQRVKDEDPMDVDEDPAAAEARQAKEDLNKLKEVTENIAERAAQLQSWIWTLLQKVDKTQLLTNGDVMAPPSPMELQEKLTRLEAENTSLQERILELARSRDEIVESDRRVRRGLYRLAAGRVELKEVLKAVASADQDKEAAAAWMETPAIPVVGSSTTSSTVVKSAAENIKSEDAIEKQVSAEEMTQLQKQVADLAEVASSRDNKIKQVRFAIIFSTHIAGIFAHVIVFF